MKRLLLNIGCFTVAAVATFCFGLKAYASTATNPTYGTITFEGEFCDSLRRAAQSRHYAMFPTSVYYNVFACSKDRFVPGDQVTVQFVNGTAGDPSTAIPFTINTVDGPSNTGGYIGFVGLACCFGVGVIAGKMR
jgi:hypothetical protein